jgi:type IV secretion system protein VirD4
MPRVTDPLYTLPNFSHRERRATLLAALVFLGVDTLLAFEAASQYLAHRWGHHAALGPAWSRAAAYPVPALLAGAGTVAAALLAASLIPPLRRRALAWVPAVGALVLAATAPLYPPWAVLVWTARYDQVSEALPALDAARNVLAAALVLFMLPALVYVRARLRANRPVGDTHGSSRWATPAEVRATGLLAVRPGVVVGAYRVGRTRQHLVSSGEDHCLLYAPSGSGKTACLVIPTLLSWPHSAVVLDIKGELFHYTAGYRREHLGNLVLRFDPACVDGSAARYNPLAAIPRGDGDVRATQVLADMLVDPDGKLAERTFWTDSAQALHTALILHTLWVGRDKSLAGCLDLLASPARPFHETCKLMLRAVHDPALTAGWVDPSTGLLTATHPVVSAAARALLDMDERVRSSVVASTRVHLELWRDPVVAGNTAAADFAVRDLVQHERPVTLYLTVSPADLSRLRGLLRIVLQQLCTGLTERMDFDAATNRPRVHHPLLFVLDEFTSLGKMEFFARNLAYLRGYGIRVFLSFQALAQLIALYGRYQAITANCNVQAAFHVNDVETSELLSKSLGTTTVSFEREQRAGKALGLHMPRASVAPTESARPLRTPDELRRLPAGEAIVLVAGHPPVLAERWPYFRDPELARRAAVPPPPLSDRIPTRTAWDEPPRAATPGGGEPPPVAPLSRRELDELLATATPE